jgi:hypothetical protein
MSQFWTLSIVPSDYILSLSSVEPTQLCPAVRASRCFRTLVITRRMVSSGLLRRVARVRTDVSEERWAAYVGC